jgi:hypothetical protein
MGMGTAARSKIRPGKKWVNKKNAAGPDRCMAPLHNFRSAALLQIYVWLCTHLRYAGWLEPAKPSSPQDAIDGCRFRLRSASYGGRSRSLSYGGQVAPPILRAIVAWDKVAGRQTLNCFEARSPRAKEEMPARPSSALTPASPQRRLLESWSSAPHPFHLS